MEHVSNCFGHFIFYCSDGCGRTGSFIAMCLLIDRLKTEGVVDIFQTVRGLRLQRPEMVRSVVRSDIIIIIMYNCTHNYSFTWCIDMLNNNYYSIHDATKLNH